MWRGLSALSYLANNFFSRAGPERSFFFSFLTISNACGFFTVWLLHLPTRASFPNCSLQLKESAGQKPKKNERVWINIWTSELKSSWEKKRERERDKMKDIKESWRTEKWFEQIYRTYKNIFRNWGRKRRKLLLPPKARTISNSRFTTAGVVISTRVIWIDNYLLWFNFYSSHRICIRVQQKIFAINSYFKRFSVS